MKDMKSKIFQFVCACLMCCGITAALTACDDDDSKNEMMLGGDCDIEAIALDDYEGIVDAKTHTIVVRLPEIYETAAMKVTKLKLSAGATCNVVEGQTLNMKASKNLRVKNGDVVLNWTLSVMNDEARITQFVINDIYTGAIDQTTKTITVYVPASVGLTGLVPTITYSANATITPASGVAQDFTQPVQYKVKNNSAESTYTAKVIAIDKPSVLFIGSAASLSELDPEAKAACQWMLGNVANSLYVSFADLRAGTVDLSQCKVIWWHWHVDGGVDGHDVFMAKATDALNTKNEIRQFYENGGSLFMTRCAVNLPSFIGATGDDDGTTPNNCWGQNEDAAELCNGPWDFLMYTGQNNHPIYQGLIAGDDPNRVYCTDAGYHITNTTSQYHIGTDWGGYDNYAAWEARTGATILGVGGDGAIVLWEYPAKDNKGAIICIGSGCFDWYSYTYEAGYVEKFHKNIEIMTQNAFNYLMNK